MNKVSDTSLIGSNINLDLILNDFFIKILLISKHIIIGMFKYPIWLIIFFSLLLKKFDKKELHFFYFAILSIFFVYFIYIAEDFQKLHWLLSGSADRILFHLSGFFMLFLSYRLKFFCDKFIK